jgi:hydroxymethylbilane synthase
MVIGTDSPRRVAQLRRIYPEARFESIRGNVDTRLRKVAEGELDAVILAAAGLDRLHRLDAVTEYLGLDGWPTAPGQGALAIEVRAGDEKLVKALDHTTSRIIVEAERRTLALLEAGCSAPVGAHALIDDGMLFLSARVYSADPSTGSGTDYITSSHALYVSDTKDPAGDLAERVATELFELGAAELMGPPA